MNFICCCNGDGGGWKKCHKIQFRKFPNRLHVHDEISVVSGSFCPDVCHDVCVACLSGNRIAKFERTINFWKIGGRLYWSLHLQKKCAWNFGAANCWQTFRFLVSGHHIWLHSLSLKFTINTMIPSIFLIPTSAILKLIMSIVLFSV